MTPNMIPLQLQNLISQTTISTNIINCEITRMKQQIHAEIISSIQFFPKRQKNNNNTPDFDVFPFVNCSRCRFKDFLSIWEKNLLEDHINVIFLSNQREKGKVHGTWVRNAERYRKSRERERGRVDRGTETEAQRRSPPSKEQKNIILLF